MISCGVYELNRHFKSINKLGSVQTYHERHFLKKVRQQKARVVSGGKFDVVNEV